METKPAGVAPEGMGEHMGSGRKAEGRRIEHTKSTAESSGKNASPPGEEGKGGACGTGAENAVEKGTSVANEIPLRLEGECNTKPDLQFDDSMVAHLQMALSLIEHRNVSQNEVIELLRKTMRQRGMGSERRIDYVLRYLTEHPP